MSAAVHFWSHASPSVTRCNRVVLDYARVSHSWAEVTCKWCLREHERDLAPSPVSGEGPEGKDVT